MAMILRLYYLPNFTNYKEVIAMKKLISVVTTVVLLIAFVCSVDIKAEAASGVSYDEKVIFFDYYTNSIGNVEYYGIVEINNTGKNDIYLSGCTFDIEDNNGHLLQSDDWISTCRDVIGPGEKGYFYNDLGSSQFSDGVNTSNGVNLVPTCSIKAATGKPHSYEVIDTDLKEGTWGYPSITGRVVNDTNKDISYIFINFIFYDKSGKIIGIDGTSIMDIPAGKKGSFDSTIMFGHDDLTLKNIANYEIIAEDDYYQW